MEIGEGFCHCGCGNKTPLAKHTSTRDRTIKGKPVRYLQGHSNKKGRENSCWKGDIVFYNGYALIESPNHPNSKGGREYRSRIIVEKAIGKYLPKYSTIHHLDHNRDNDSNSNLVACENIAYHNMLHRREEALKECGHANWRKCRYCGKYDDPKNMYQEPFKIGKYTDSCRHRECYNMYMVRYNKKRKIALIGL